MENGDDQESTTAIAIVGDEEDTNTNNEEETMTLAMTIPPDPPEFSEADHGLDDNIPFSRSIAVAESFGCSPQAQEEEEEQLLSPSTMMMTTTPPQPQLRGVDPDEFLIEDSCPSPRESIVSSQSPDAVDALVPYEHPPKATESDNSQGSSEDNNNKKATKRSSSNELSSRALMRMESRELNDHKTSNKTYNKTGSGSGEDVNSGAIVVRLDSRDVKPNHHTSSRANRGKKHQLVVAKQPTSTELVIKPPSIDSKDTRFGFDHCYVTVPCKERLSVLFATLRRSSDRKVIVICSTWESAQFHAVLFRQLEMLHIYEMHENMAKSMDGGNSNENYNVAQAYDKFLYQYPGILFTSDIAMREFDVPPNVDYIIQYEPPMNPTEYIYRMSNAKIYKTSCHKSLLFISPEELPFLEYFDHIPNKELEARKVSEFQGSVEKLVSKHSELNDMAWKAFRAFMYAYEGHSHGDIYDHTKIDEDGIRRSFGQPHIPESSSKYFVYKQSNGEVTTMKKSGSGGKSRGNSSKTENEKVENDSEHPSSKDGNGSKNPHQWMDKEKTTWRKSGKPWTTRENKTWKHSRLVG